VTVGLPVSGKAYGGSNFQKPLSSRRALVQKVGSDRPPRERRCAGCHEIKKLCCDSAFVRRMSRKMLMSKKSDVDFTVGSLAVSTLPLYHAGVDGKGRPPHGSGHRAELPPRLLSSVVRRTSQRWKRPDGLWGGKTFSSSKRLGRGPEPELHASKKKQIQTVHSQINKKFLKKILIPPLRNPSPA